MRFIFLVDNDFCILFLVFYFNCGGNLIKNQSILVDSKEINLERKKFSMLYLWL